MIFYLKCMLVLYDGNDKEYLIHYVAIPREIVF